VGSRSCACVDPALMTASFDVALGYREVRRGEEVAGIKTRQDCRWRSSCDGGDGKDVVVFRGQGASTSVDDFEGSKYEAPNRG
jgi:hypothetical protein